MTDMTDMTDIYALVKNPKAYTENLEDDELVELLQNLSDAYYNDESLVPDAIYDQLIDILKKRDPKNAFLKKVGAPIKGTKEKVTLPFEMGSLNKFKLEKDIDAWANKYDGPYFISDKLDGASAQIYKNQSGEILMFSRGDGTVGQNISHLLPHIFSDKILESIPKGTSIRGELIISIKNFKKIEKIMKTARNAASGLINSKTVNQDVAKIADFVAYAILNPRYDYEKQMVLLKKWGFNVVTHIFEDEISEEFFKEYLTKRKKESLYEMDGIVCVDTSKVYAHKGGYRDHEFAFKMDSDDQMVITTVIEVLWKPSKDGYLKPKIRLDPVELGGTTVTYVAAYNAKFVVDNKIGPGARVKVMRSGDVIPKIMEIVMSAKEPQMPQFPYKWNDSKVDLLLKDESDENGKKIMTIRSLVHFFKKLNVQYMSEGIITKLVENDYDSIESILTAKKKDLYQISGLGEKIIDKIYTEIDRAFDEMTLEMFMAASNKLGRSIGETRIKEILNIYPNLLNEPEDGLYDKIMKVAGFSDTTTEMFVNNLPSFKKFYKKIAKIKDLSRFDNIVVQSTVKASGKLDGQTFVMTGTRDAEIIKYITDNGGKIGSSVSKNTTMLIHADDADTTTNKFTKAIDLGVKLIKVSDVRKKFNLT
jgi:DNA ligase (NAD+)